MHAKGATHWHRETTIFFNCVISNTKPAQRATVATAQRMVSGHSGTPTLLGELLTVTVGGCGPRWSGDGRRLGQWRPSRASETHSDALGCSSQTGEGVSEAPDSRNVGGNERGSSSQRLTLLTHSRIGASCARTCCKLMPTTALQPRTGLPTLA